MMWRNSPQPTAPHPPGTVPLVALSLQRDRQAVVLTPAPSNDMINDPLNWRFWRKSLNYGLLMALTTTVFIGLFIQSVCWFQMVNELDVTFNDITKGQVVQLVGLAVGCIFFIPFTRKYGRRSTYVLSTFALAAVAWWMAYMTTAEENYVTNLLFGLAGAINETAVQMSIADLFFVHQRATSNGMYFAAVCSGSYFMPILAGVIAHYYGWRASYKGLAVTLTILAVVFLAVFEETKFPRATTAPGRELVSLEADIPSSTPKRTTRASRVTLFKKASGVRPRWTSGFGRLQFITPTDDSLWKSTYFPLYAVTLPHVAFTALQFGSGVCCLVILTTMISATFSRPPYNFGSAGVGYMFLGSMVGSIFGSLYGGPLVDRHVLRSAKRNSGLFEPEMRIELYHAPAIFAAGGLIMFGVAADQGMHWIVPSIGTTFFAFGFGAIGDMAFTLVIDAYPGLISESFVAVAFFRNILSIAGPYALATWKERMSISKMFIMTAFISLAINLLWIPLVIWGKKLRQSTAQRYDRLCREAASS